MSYIRIIPLLFIMIFGHQLFAQNAFYDAQKISTIQSKELKIWNESNLIKKYTKIGLLESDELNINQINAFKELIQFIDDPFEAIGIDNLPKLYYQLETYQFIKLAIAENQEFKENFLKYLTLIDSNAKITSSGLELSCGKQEDFLDAIYNQDAVTYIELCNCLQADKKTTFLQVFYGGQGDLGFKSIAADDLSFRKKEKALEAPSFADIGTITGGNFTSMFVDALAQFLIQRTKKELSIAFFDKFKKKIEEFPEVKAFFPATYGLLEGLMEFKEPSIGKAWVEAFSNDIITLPKNFEQFVLLSDKEPYKTLRTLPEFEYYRLAYHAAERISEGTNGADLIVYLNTFYKNGTNKDLKNILEITFLLSQNIRCAKDCGDQQIWIHPSAFLGLNTRTKMLFLGLLYQKKPALIEELFDTTPNQIENTLEQLNSFLIICENIQNEQDALEEALEDEDITEQGRIKAYLKYSKVVFELIDFGFSMAPLAQENEYALRFRPIMDDILSTIQAISEKDYAQISAYSLKTILSLTEYGLEKSIMNSNNADTLKRVQKVREAMRQVSFYGNFIVDIASADSTHEIRRILRKYAAPVGSYRIKRNSRFSIDLNAFVGIYGGLEYTPQAKNDTTNNLYASAYGVTAPVGLSFNWGSGKQLKTPSTVTGADLTDGTFLRGNKKGWKKISGASNSLFLGIIDIGAAVSYRWNGNETDGFPDSLRFEQIFSPSLHYVHGFKNAPLSLAIGIQYTPSLRSIENGGNIVQELNAIRLGITLSVDIPIFNLYKRRHRN